MCWPFVRMKMNPLVERDGKPEKKIQNALITYLQYKGWFVMVTHGNMYQRGFPDLWATHKFYGARWIEVKNPKKYAFTPAQIEVFPKICANGSGIWVLVAANGTEYEKLFKAFNWFQYLHM